MVVHGGEQQEIRHTLKEMKFLENINKKININIKRLGARIKCERV